MKSTKKKTFIILVLCVALILMGTGYAILSTSLKITGTNTVSGKWDIYIQSITPTTVAGDAVSRNVTIGENKLSASFKADLYGNDDYVEYTVIIKNNGNIPAKLVDITTNTLNPSEFVKFTNTAVKDKILNPGATDTFTVKVAVNNPNAAELVDTEDVTYKINLTYLQNTSANSNT